MNDRNLRYYDACQYAREALSDDIAPQYFSRLYQLARYAPLEDLQALIDSWRPPTPKITLPEPPAPEPWTMCSHFGGDRDCDICSLKDCKAGLIYAGAMALAQKMFELPVEEGGCRPFVRQRIHAELLPYTGGKVYPGFDDLEQKVWTSIAASIAGYRDAKTPLAWLRPVVQGVVVKHFRDSWRQMRDLRKETQFSIETHDSVSPDSPVSPPAKATAVVKPE